MIKNSPRNYVDNLRLISESSLKITKLIQIKIENNKMKNQYRQLHIEEFLNTHESPGDENLKNFSLKFTLFYHNNIPLLILVPWFDQEEPFL